MKRITTAVSLIIITFVLLFDPSITNAQTSFVPCDGLNCSACDFATMANTILVWLIGVLFVVFAVIMAVAGFGLVTSGGNPSAKEAAKSKFVNAIVGLIIVLAAWVLVDTIMRGLLAGGTGQIQGWGPWSQISCQKQTDTRVVTLNADTMTTSAPVSCDADASGRNINCAAAVAACEAKDGTAHTDTSNPDNHTVVCETYVGVSSGDTTVLCDEGPGGDRTECTAQIDACRNDEGGTPEVQEVAGTDDLQVLCEMPSAVAGACDTSQMTSMKLFGHNVTVSKQVESSLRSIDAAWQSRGGNSFYRVYSVGGYNCRKVTGGSSWSVHAYGLAVDINPKDNPYQKPAPAVCTTNMPSSFSGLFTGSGWGWGCNWRSAKDAMHFSKASKEGGNISI